MPDKSAEDIEVPAGPNPPGHLPPLGRLPLGSKPLTLVDHRGVVAGDDLTLGLAPLGLRLVLPQDPLIPEDECQVCLVPHPRPPEAGHLLSNKLPHNTPEPVAVRGKL